MELEEMVKQSIEEFLIGKTYNDATTHEPYCKIVDYSSSEKLFTEILKQSFDSIATTIHHVYLDEIIETIKVHKNENQKLYDELFEYYPECLL